MKKITLNLLFVCCLCSTLFAQTPLKTEPLALKTTTATLNTAEKVAVDTVFAKYELLSINFTQLKAMLRNLQGDKTATFVLELPNMPKMTVAVQPNDLRSPNFIANINGSQENLPIEMRECITFKGKIKEDATSEVLLTITDDLLICNFTFANIAYTIEPCSNYQTTGKEFVFYANSARMHKENTKFCGTMENSELAKQEIINSAPSTQKLQGCKIAEVALDADYYFYDQYKANAYGIMMSNFISVAELYRRDLNIQLLIVYTNIFSNKVTCPYTQGTLVDDSSYSAGDDYLGKAKNYWLNQDISRDLVHIFSGKNFQNRQLGGQVIRIGTACVVKNEAIGFTSFKSDAGNKSAIMAHEIGHLFDGEHQGCAFIGVFGDNTIMCGGTFNLAWRFSDDSKEEIGRFINSNIECFSTLTGLDDKIEGGSDFICDNTPNPIYTFAIPRTNWTPWGNPIWTSTGNITLTPRVSLNPNESAVEVTKTGDGIATLTFSYRIDGVSCPLQVFTKTIYLGKPTDFELRTEENSQNCRDISPIIYIDGSENAKQVRWEYMHPTTRVWTSYGMLPYSGGYFEPNFFTIPEFSAWYRFARQGACISFSFRAIPINDCGELTQGTENTSVILTFCKGGGAMYCRQAQTTTNETLALKLSPNPAEDVMVEISIIGNGYEVVSASELYEVVIYNTLGQVVKTFKTKDLQNKVDVQDLKVGIYIVKVVYQDQILQNKLMINR